MFNIFKRTDSICGMKEQKGAGVTKNDKWFCSKDCAKEFERQRKGEKNKKTGCC